MFPWAWECCPVLTAWIWHCGRPTLFFFFFCKMKTLFMNSQWWRSSLLLTCSLRACLLLGDEGQEMRLSWGLLLRITGIPFHLSLPLWTEENMARSDGGTGKKKMWKPLLGPGEGKSCSSFALVCSGPGDEHTEGSEGKGLVTDRLGWEGTRMPGFLTFPGQLPTRSTATLMLRVTGQTADPRRYSLDKRLPKGQPIREARGVVALLENFQEFCAVLFCVRVEVGWCCDWTPPHSCPWLSVHSFLLSIYMLVHQKYTANKTIT